MPFQLQYGVRTLNPTYVHEWAGPYTGVDETAAKALANATIPSPVRLQGLEVVLIWGGVPYKYWYKNGIADGDLVPMVTGSALEVQDEGTPVVNPTNTINFIGSAVTVTNPSPGQADVTIAACDSYTFDIVEGCFKTAFPLVSGDSSHLDPILASGANSWNTDVWSDSPENNDAYGNIIQIGKELTAIKMGVPLSTDLNPGDKIKLCGSVATEENFTDPFVVFTVSYYTCSDLDVYKVPPTSLILPTTFYLTTGPGNTDKVCYSAEVTLSTTLLACETFFIIGFQGGNPSKDGIYFTANYKLSATKNCNYIPPPPVQNLRIRSCCDPLYEEVIANPASLIVGDAFVDKEGNCFTVIAITSDPPVPIVRQFGEIYNNCTSCISSNPCPDNLKIQSCCFGGDYVFTSAIPGVNIGDSFVDTDGNCWKAIDTTYTPTTGEVIVATIYTEDDCTACIDANICPVYVYIQPCCDGAINAWAGVTTYANIGGGVNAINDVFKDQFGYCWNVKNISEGPTTIPFIYAVTKYDTCEDCNLTWPGPDDPCKRNNKLYYTIKNCCDSSLEVIEVDSLSFYPIGQVFGLIAAETAGCFSVVSWSTTGTPTLTNIEYIYTSSAPGSCNVCLATSFSLNPYTTSEFQHLAYCRKSVITCDNIQCKTYINYTGGPVGIYGWGCDGTYYYNYPLGDLEQICLTSIFYYTPSSNVTYIGLCCFRVNNLSSIETIYLESCSTNCNDNSGQYSLLPSSSACYTIFLPSAGSEDVPYTIDQIGTCI